LRLTLVRNDKKRELRIHPRRPESRTFKAPPAHLSFGESLSAPLGGKTAKPLGPRHQIQWAAPHTTPPQKEVERRESFAASARNAICIFMSFRSPPFSRCSKTQPLCDRELSLYSPLYSSPLQCAPSIFVSARVTGEEKGISRHLFLNAALSAKVLIYIPSSPLTRVSWKRLAFICHTTTGAASPSGDVKDGWVRELGFTGCADFPLMSNADAAAHHASPDLCAAASFSTRSRPSPPPPPPLSYVAQSPPLFFPR